ncbi:hypothetical protein [Saccharopolyspora cebuensis]
MLPEDWHPAGRRWPKPDETRTDEEAKAYARLAKSRSNGHLLSGEFLIALGGAMMGSVAMDVFSQGPNAELEKEIGLVVAAVLVAIGLLLARMMSPSWGKVADRYEKFARPNRRRAPSRRRRAPSARRLPATDAPTRRSKFSPFTIGTKRRGPADSSRPRGRER